MGEKLRTVHAPELKERVNTAERRLLQLGYEIEDMRKNVIDRERYERMQTFAFIITSVGCTLLGMAFATVIWRFL